MHKRRSRDDYYRFFTEPWEPLRRRIDVLPPATLPSRSPVAPASHNAVIFIRKDGIFMCKNKGKRNGKRKNGKKVELVSFKLRVPQMICNERSLWIWLGVCEHLWHLCLRGGRTSSHVMILVCNYGALNCIQPWFVSLLISTFIVQEAVDTRRSWGSSTCSCWDKWML